MKRYTARIEFGIPGHKDIVKENVLVALTIMGYDTDAIVSPFEHKIFQDKCHKAVGDHSTFGIQRVINCASHKSLRRAVEQAEKEGEGLFYEYTDHDLQRDYFLRIKVTTETKRQMMNRIGIKEIPKTWWCFGIATYNLDKLIIQDGDYWYHMFGHFYFNTGKRK